MKQQPLFRMEYGPNSRRSDRQTSVDAATGARRSAPKLKAVILGLLLDRVDGLTDDQLCELLPGEHPGSVSKRRSDLVKDGLVVAHWSTRTTRFGREATVWVATRES